MDMGVKFARLAFVVACAAILVLLLSRAEGAQAAPQSGTFTVNTADDSYTQGDGVISLREAMAVANGSLTGPFNYAERTQLAGCAFNASGYITAYCGGGNDSIQFTPVLTEVHLTSRLPAIVSVASGLTINGAVNSGDIIINGQNQADYGFNVGADNVTIKNVAVVNINGFGAAVGMGNGSWKGLQVTNSYLGVFPNSASCSDPRIVADPYFTVILFGGSGTSGAGDGTAYFSDDVIGCSRNDGIAISNAPYVYVGQDKNGAAGRHWIGATRSGGAIGNGATGVNACCSSSVQGNQLLSNTNAYNSREGVFLEYAGPQLLSGNEIHHNGLAGVHVYSTTQTTLVNNVIHDNDGSGVWFDQGASIQNHLTGGAIYHNGAAGITEGNGAYNNTWRFMSTYDNFGLGIDKGDNGVPDPPPLSIDSALRSNGVVTVSGRYLGKVFLQVFYNIDLYRLALDPTGYGEGRTYVGSALVQWNMGSDYSWHIADPAGTRGCYTAVVTVVDALGGSVYNTSSEYSSDYVCTAYVPNVVR